MLDLLTGAPGRPLCDGVSRREFLRIGSLGLAGVTLADRLAAQARASGAASYVRDKAVVFLFLAGGPSQYETFDPKPDGFEQHTSINGHIPTRLPGVRFSAYLPKLAALADRLTVVRSFQTHHAEHNGAHKQLLTADLTVADGKPIKEPGLGAVYARVAGAVNEHTGLPRHALITPTLNYPGAGKGFAGSFESVVEGVQPAALGPAFAPLEVQAAMAGGAAESKKKKKRSAEPEDDAVANPFLDALEHRLQAPRLDARLELGRQLDSLARHVDSPAAESLDARRRQALDLLLGGEVRKAFDLTLEDPATLRAYDTEHFRNWQCDDHSRFIRTEPSLGFSLGRQLLLARRLCEAGAGFVTVVNANWDFHARKGIPNTPEGMGVFAPPLDHAVSAFLQDLRQRGLEEKILLVITGEFGRSGLDANLGRHHHPDLCPLVFAGGGLRHGQVIGQSDRRGARPADAPLVIDDLHATILHFLFDVGKMRLDVALPAKIQERAQKGRPIAGLWG